MEIKPINTQADYQAALQNIESLMMAKPNTAEGEKLDVLLTLVDDDEFAGSVVLTADFRLKITDSTLCMLV